ncbi:unnamed protein product [Prunus armeniaca]|uniref:Uncharacterized protein n=1 Tax=Prunus armeniaca TaxID=36596 RepID=A0A6J5TX27_PRUAR|nr:unnamed protein product [Prunus armeniaca]
MCCISVIRTIYVLVLNSTNSPAPKTPIPLVNHEPQTRDVNHVSLKYNAWDGKEGGGGGKGGQASMRFFMEEGDVRGRE